MVVSSLCTLALFHLAGSRPAVSRATTTLLFTRRRSVALSLVAQLTGLVLPSNSGIRPCQAQELPKNCHSSHLTTQQCRPLKMSTNPDDIVESMTGYLDAASAAALDAELMATPGFTLEQLMELAGLAVAEAVYSVLQQEQKPNHTKILLVCGPGNNGGDGLVAARHLAMFGYDCTVVYPKRPFTKQPHYANLVQQCEDLGMVVVDEMPTDFVESLQSQATEDGAPPYSAIVDAIFGFSFQGTPREPFATMLQQMQQAQRDQKVTLVSVDVPSGWNVNEGDVTDSGFMPDVLVSLTTPKECARQFTGPYHFVGGRFLPPGLAQKYKVRMPPYPGVAQVMQVSRGGGGGDGDNYSWEKDYAAYLAEKEAKEFAATEKEEAPIASGTDSIKQEGGDVLLSSWEAEYAEYLAEKEGSSKTGDANNNDKK